MLIKCELRLRLIVSVPVTLKSLARIALPKVLDIKVMLNLLAENVRAWRI